MKASLIVAAALVLCIATAALASESRASSPDARFMEAGTEVESEAESSMLRPVSVVDSSQYAALKHEQAQKALRDLHLPGEHADIYAQLGIEKDADSESEEGADEDAAADESDAELLTLAAETEEGAEGSEDAEEDSAEVEDLEAEISAAEDAAFLQIDEEDAADEEADEEAEDEAEDESEDEADEEDSDEADEEDSDESEDEADDESGDETEEEVDEEEEALIEEEAAPAYISPVLRPALPQKHKDVMPDSNYDKVAETNLLPNPFRRALKARKVKAGKPNPAARGKRRGGRRSRKSRRAAARKGRGKGKGKGRGKGKGKGRKGVKKGRKAGRAGRRGGRRGGKWPFDGKDPRALVTPPSLQSIWDARHKQFISSTNSLIKELDDGLIEHGIHPPLADPNKKKCKKKRNSRK